MDESERDLFLFVQPFENNIEHNADDQIVRQQILREDVAELENVNLFIPMDFGEARPVDHFPVDPRNYLEAFTDFDMNVVQPVEVDHEITHPIVDGGLNDGRLNYLIGDHDEIVFSTTVIVVYPDLLDQNGDDDDDDEEILIAEEIDGPILLNHQTPEIIDELITTELMETEDSLIEDTTDTPVVITTNNVEENIPVTPVVQHEPEGNAETVNETPQTTTPVILVPEVPHNNQEASMAELVGEAADRIPIPTEPETADANINDSVGPQGVPVHAHGHHRSKSAEPVLSIHVNENLSPHRCRSRTIH